LNVSESAEPQVLSMTANKKGWGKDVIYFEGGKKVKWIIDVKELTMCNKTIEIPALELKQDLVEGRNCIEFDPGNHGSLVYTCWMGMMRGEFRAK
jgi:plastocyanin domain-containing protein